jgi:hypothetical protein
VKIDNLKQKVSTMSTDQYFPPHYAVPHKLASGETSRYFVRNTVDVANQLLDAIEKDISDSKDAISARDSYKNNMERENSRLQQQLMAARVSNEESCVCCYSHYVIE